MPAAVTARQESVGPIPAPTPSATECQQTGCAKTQTVRCQYRDRRARICNTYWCNQHIQSFEGTQYCRRHAGMIAALAQSTYIDHRPDVSNRAPSLANWVADAIDDRVVSLLEAQLDAAADETLLVDSISYYFIAAGRHHRWERAWKVLTHTGVRLKVSVSADEADDALLIVQVGSKELLTTVPPWIQRNRRGESLDPDSEARERKAFYDYLLDEIGKALVKELGAESNFYRTQ